MTAIIPTQRPPADTWPLVERAQAGDPQAFAALHRHYNDTIYRYAYYRLGGHRQKAEDVTGEVWARTVKRINGVTWQGRDFGAWLITLTRNLVADYYKSGWYRYEITTDVMADDPDTHPGASPEHVAIQRLETARLYAAMRQLSPDQRRCLELRFLAGLTDSQTAAVMGKNAGAIKALQFRAVRALRRIMEVANDQHR